MNRQPFEKPPRVWEPKLSRRWISILRPWRTRLLRKSQLIETIEVQGLDHLQSAVSQKLGVLITPNHSAHYDSFCLYHASDLVDRPFYIMTAWQVFAMSNRFDVFSMVRHGCFSVDREHNDLGAFKRSVEILKTGEHPLVVFPEGDIYHTNDRVAGFREGAAAMAISAAKRASRPVVCLPTAIKFQYLDDPSPKLCELMTQLERRFTLPAQPHRTLPQRIERFADSLLTIQELEYLGQRGVGSLPDRICCLINELLRKVEASQSITTSGSVPERVKELRRQIIMKRDRQRTVSETQSALANDQSTKEHDRFAHSIDQASYDMNLLFLVIQLYSYPGNYVAEHPSVERIAETLDKFEEDVLDAPYPSIRGRRKVTIRFGEPIVVDDSNRQPIPLTRTLETKVQGMLDELRTPVK